MGRSTHPRGAPRGALVANWEVKKALREGGMPSFGIRRPFEIDASDEITDIMAELQAQKEGWPDSRKLVLRRALGVTLLDQEVVGRQLSGRRIQRYHMGIARARMLQDPDCRGRNDSITVERGPIRVHNHRVVYAKIITPEIIDEVSGITAAVKAAGLKTANKCVPPVPEATFGETFGRDWLQADEEDMVVKALEACIPQKVPVMGWRPYPFDIFEE